MHNRTRLILVAATAVLCAGCAHNTTAAPGDQPSSTASAPCKQTDKVTEADNGHTVCVQVNSQLTLRLNGTKDSLWSGVTEDSDALARDPHPRIGVPMGVTEAAYIAKHAGTVHLKSSRPVCPPGTPGTMHCNSVEAFTVTVEVH